MIPSKHIAHTLLSLFFYLFSTTVFAEVGDNSVGMNTHHPTQAMIDSCVDLGVKWIRVDGNWFNLEPSNNDYNFGFMDQIVERANTAGLQVYITLAYTPEWVPRHGDSDGQYHNDAPNNSEHWTDFIRAVVPHYRAMGVTHFGLWNEPNLDGFWEGSLQEYVDIIALPGAATIREICEDCMVLGPDLAPIRDPDDALEYILSRTLTTWDILTHHIYKGFHETDQEIWEDTFINQLDQGLIPFISTRGLTEIFETVGWSGEVWITETGHHCEPAENPEQEEMQATYVTRVLEEQLARDWYTNTFFYEITDCGPDQPECTIDGFGLMRATSGNPGSRQFPNDFRLKPAFIALRNFIDDHPEITGSGPSPACSDGIDNDQDGNTDLADRGCSDPFDDDESDDPQRDIFEAYYHDDITIDGDAADFGEPGWLILGTESWTGTEPLGSGDLEVRAAARWSEQGLSLAFFVTDDLHDNTHSIADLWMGDSVQIALDIRQNGGQEYDDSDDHEINIAWANNQTQVYRFHGPSNASNEIDAAIMLNGDQITYEIFLAHSAIPSATMQTNTTLGFSFLVNDADGSGRTGWIEWTPGIGSGKIPELFGEILFKEEEIIVDEIEHSEVVEEIDTLEDTTTSPETTDVVEEVVVPDSAPDNIDDISEQDTQITDDTYITPDDGQTTSTTDAQQDSNSNPEQTTVESGCGCFIYTHQQPNSGSGWGFIVFTVFFLRRRLYGRRT